MATTLKLLAADLDSRQRKECCKEWGLTCCASTHGPHGLVCQHLIHDGMLVRRRPRLSSGPSWSGGAGGSNLLQHNVQVAHVTCSAQLWPLAGLHSGTNGVESLSEAKMQWVWLAKKASFKKTGYSVAEQLWDLLAGTLSINLKFREAVA